MHTQTQFKRSLKILWRRCKQIRPNINKKNAHGELQILEVDYWTQTPILAVIGTFTVTLSTYILIETQEKEVPRTSLEKYAWLSTCYVKKIIIVVEIFVTQIAFKNVFIK